MNPKVDFFFKKADNWQDAFLKLRAIVAGCRLTEELKWGVPCYTNGASNIVLMHGFKDYCALLFFKGALLKDPNGILIQQTENVQAARQIRFTCLQDVLDLEPVIVSYIKEALEVEKAGLKVAMITTAEYAMPEEFRIKLDELPELKTAFLALTPGRQRAYLYHFSQPKQAKTRIQRIEKYIPKILEGKGVED